MANWTQEAEEHLVTMVEERPALYDIRESLYTNKVVKADLWRQIENKLVISEKFLKKRWESLRTQYTRYKKLPPSGSGGAQRTGRQQWILTRLQFLEPHTKKKDTTHNPAPMEDLGAPVDLDTRADDTSSFNIEVLSSPPHCETRSSTPVEEPCVSEAAPVPYAHMATSSISRSEPTTIPFSEEPCQTTKRDSSTSVPPTKRRRKMLEEPVSWESTNLMRIIGKTLERLGSREEQDDEISAYCKNIECRMRKLPRHVLPHFEHEVDICLYKYLVGQSPGNHSGPGCTADQPEVFPCSLPHMCLNRVNDQLGELGKGAGKGGGGGGSVREAGGAFGKREAAEEERYFRQKEKEQLAALRKHHEEEIDHHKKEIERLQREIDRHWGKIRKLKHDD